MLEISLCGSRPESNSITIFDRISSYQIKRFNHVLLDANTKSFDASKIKGQRPEASGQRSEVNGHRSEARGQWSEVNGQRSTVKGQRA